MGDDGLPLQARALREHVAMQDFVHKWELPLRAYAQLRTQVGLGFRV